MLAARSMPGLATRLMNSAAIPRVYERWWRPALGFLATAGRNRAMEQEFAEAADALRIGPGSTVLDLACGTGAFSRAFAERVAPDGRVIGLDASPTMLDQARASTPAGLPITYVHGDAHDLPVPDDSVDAVCCYAALHLMADPDAVIAAAARALRPGGRIAVFTTARCDGLPGVDRVIGTVAGLRMFGRTEVAELLTRHGFIDIDVRTAGLTQTLAATCEGEPA